MNDKKESISILTYHMVPYSNSWGGAQRIYYLARFLVKNGYNVTVYCLDQGYRDYEHEVDFNVVPLLLSNPLNQNKTKESKKIKKINISNFLKEKIIKPSIKKILNFIFNDLSDFDSMQSLRLIRSYSGKISDDLNKQGCKNLIISGPPFTLFNIVKPLRKRTKDLNIILDYRDPWNVWTKGSVVSRMIERRLLSKVNGLVFTNEPLLNKTLSYFNVLNKQATVASNGYDKKSWENLNNKIFVNKILTINYVGSINISDVISKYRDTKVFFKSVEKFISLGFNIKINFIGVSNITNPTIDGYINIFKGKVAFYTRVNKVESLSKMLDSDVLLLMHNVNDDSGQYIVNGKFYDYAASKKPIFYIGKSNDIHWTEIEKNNLGFVSNNTIEDITLNLKKIYHLWERQELNKYGCDVNLLQEYSRDFQYDKLLRLLK